MADQVELVVPAALDHARVDKAVAELLDVSRARASVVVGRGVWVDGAPAKPSDRVGEGQVILCERPDHALGLEPEDIAVDVLFEDDWVVVVNKPPGMVVHPGSGQKSSTLAAGLLFRYPDLVGVGTADRWGLVHRLDKDTSGALLVARTQAAFDSLTAQLRAREIRRSYVALVEGSMSTPTGTVDAPIGRDPKRPTRRAVTHGGKAARTHYEVKRQFAASDVSLLDVTLETGRTHQIRVHLAAIGHPVVGDAFYGATRKDLRPPRTFLHSARVGFAHPGEDREMVVDAPLPGDLGEFLADLEDTQPGNDEPAIPFAP